MTVKGGTSQACAACKYQRRRCSPECALAPYFPANHPKMFQNAHRLYGVCNIMKILRQSNDDEQKEEAMKSIIYESNMREKFPVHGCCGIIRQLHYQLRQAIEELQYVHAQLAICREKCFTQVPSSPHFSPSSELQLGLNPTGTDAVPVFQHYSAGNEMPFAMNDFLTNENDGVYNNLADNQAQWVANSHAFRFKPESGISRDYDGMPAVETIADDRQSYIESEEACESSSESSLKDATQSMIEDVKTGGVSNCFIVPPFLKLF
ncbi:unnamed protein product [Ilex paraguariensis]|uniref:LOB domain-containing protein n=1 Tax=Ilex paraguariensis TaxID=185542 RepID=A0ABC8T088_9AQUA